LSPSSKTKCHPKRRAELETGPYKEKKRKKKKKEKACLGCGIIRARGQKIACGIPLDHIDLILSEIKEEGGR